MDGQDAGIFEQLSSEFFGSVITMGENIQDSRLPTIKNLYAVGFNVTFLGILLNKILEKNAFDEFGFVVIFLSQLSYGIFKKTPKPKNH